MKKRIAVVGNVAESMWLQKVEAPLKTIGDVATHSEGDLDDLTPSLKADLIIVDSSGVSDAVALVRRIKDNNTTTPLLVVTASPTWRRAREMFKAGAADYLKQTDVERLIQIVRSTLFKETILLADNHPDFLEIMAEFFEKRGHLVLKADTPEAAQNLLLKKTPDIAVVDFRLHDDCDDRDRSGLELVLRLYNHIETKFIVLTRQNPSAEEILPLLVPDANNRRPAVNFVLKRDGLDVLYEAVELLCHVNFEYLADRMMQHFNQDELKHFCYFELGGVDYEELAGVNKMTKVMSLVQHQARRGRVRELVKRLAKKRPNVDFVGARSERF